jgi:hypothetical protein
MRGGLSQAARHVGVVLVIILWLITTGLLFWSVFHLRRSINADFSVFWTAGWMVFENPARLYDHEFMTRAQDWLINSGPRPFAYPPSSLLFFAPFGLLPFWTAYGVWVALSVAAFIAASRMVAKPIAVGLALLSPAVVQAAYVGQTSLLLGAAAMSGIALVPRRPVVAGAILGVAAAVKPQMFVLAPVLLWGNWSALAGFVGGGAAMFVASLAFGPHLWIDWLAGVRSFAEIIEGMGITDYGVSPLSAAGFFGITGLGALAIQAVGILAGVALAIWARRGNTQVQVFGLLAGAFLCSPYVMFYDLAGLAPVLTTALLSARLSGILAGLPLAMIATPITFPVAVAAFVGGRRANA